MTSSHMQHVGAQTLAAKVTGAPAAIIIVVVLALIIIGIVAVIRFVGRKARGK